MNKISVEGPGAAVVVRAPSPAPGPGDLLLAPLLVGICATDLELINGSLIYLRTGQTKLPITPGHEWVAEVIARGPGVTAFEVGDRVVGECSVGCGSCSACHAGAYHRCPDKQETGIIGIGGALAERMVFPAQSAHRVPAAIAIADAALVEPTAVAYRAITRLDPASGASLLIVGGGTLGYLAAVLAMNVRHLDVAVLDRSARNTARLTAVGARTPFAGETFDYILEAAGTPSALDSALDLLCPGGRIVLVGLTGNPTLPVAVDRLVVGDQTVIGSIGSPGVWPEVIALLATGAIRPSALVTHTFDLENFAEAIDLLEGDRDHAVGKILVAPNPARQAVSR
jgi:L-iditol 2-dehydrogenase